MADNYSKSALTYKGTDWKDMQSGGTPINAKNLNNIEGGIGNLTTRSNDQDTQLTDVTDRTKALEGKTDELEAAWDSVSQFSMENIASKVNVTTSGWTCDYFNVYHITSKIAYYSIRLTCTTRPTAFTEVAFSNMLPTGYTPVEPRTSLCGANATAFISNSGLLDMRPLVSLNQYDVAGVVLLG